MKKSKIYTRTGDLGETGLVSGNRVSKADHRIDLYGEVDELNSRIGLASSFIQSDEVCLFLRRIQSALFDLGSNLACEDENRGKYHLPQIKVEFVKELENEIDRLDAELVPLKTFILPGGGQAASFIHLCRTSARFVERKLVAYHQETQEALPENAAIFVNRLSDYFFVLSRYLNKAQKVEEVLWVST